jgi:hypothetical protein
MHLAEFAPSLRTLGSYRSFQRGRPEPASPETKS